MRAVHDQPRGIALTEFLARPLFAHLATTAPTGPASAPVWFAWEGGALWIIGNDRRDAFPAHIQRAPRCALSIVDFDRARGLVQQVELRGRAVVARWEQGRAVRLLQRYLGGQPAQWDPQLRGGLDAAGNVFIRFTPALILAQDASYLPT